MQSLQPCIQQRSLSFNPQACGHGVRGRNGITHQLKSWSASNFRTRVYSHRKWGCCHGFLFSDSHMHHPTHPLLHSMQQNRTTQSPVHGLHTPLELRQELLLDRQVLRKNLRPDLIARLPRRPALAGGRVDIAHREPSARPRGCVDKRAVQGPCVTRNSNSRCQPGCFVWSGVMTLSSGGHKRWWTRSRCSQLCRRTTSPSR